MVTMLKAPMQMMQGGNWLSSGSKWKVPYLMWRIGNNYGFTFCEGCAEGRREVPRDGYQQLLPLPLLARGYGLSVRLVFR